MADEALRAALIRLHQEKIEAAAMEGKSLLEYGRAQGLEMAMALLGIEFTPICPFQRGHDKRR